MRLLNDKNNYDLSKQVCNLDCKVKVKDIRNALLIILIPGLLSAITFGILLGYGGLVLGTLIGMLYSVPMSIVMTTLLLIQHGFYKKALKNVKNILALNKLDLDKKDIENCDVLEIENNKDEVTLKNGKRATRKKVIDYIVINKNKKLKIIRQMTKEIKNKFYKEKETKIEFLNDRDLINEGLITEDGKLTEKAKTLGLSLY